jgi:hypothetical protein
MVREAIDTILPAEEKLQQALCAELPGHEREWTLRVKLALVRLQKALREHKTAAEGFDGLFASVNDLSPETLSTVHRRMQKLCEDHQSFLDLASRLKIDVDGALQAFRPRKTQQALVETPVTPPIASTVPDFGAIRQRGEQLLAAMREHREAETKLLHESALTVVGVGD